MECHDYQDEHMEDGHVYYTYDIELGSDGDDDNDKQDADGGDKRRMRNKSPFRSRSRRQQQQQPQDGSSSSSSPRVRRTGRRRSQPQQQQQQLQPNPRNTVDFNDSASSWSSSASSSYYGTDDSDQDTDDDDYDRESYNDDSNSDRCVILTGPQQQQQQAEREKRGSYRLTTISHSCCDDIDSDDGNISDENDSTYSNGSVGDDYRYGSDDDDDDFDDDEVISCPSTTTSEYTSVCDLSTINEETTQDLNDERTQSTHNSFIFGFDSDCDDSFRTDSRHSYRNMNRSNSSINNVSSSIHSRSKSRSKRNTHCPLPPVIRTTNTTKPSTNGRTMSVPSISLSSSSPSSSPASSPVIFGTKRPDPCDHNERSSLPPRPPTRVSYSPIQRQRSFSVMDDTDDNEDDDNDCEKVEKEQNDIDNSQPCQEKEEQQQEESDGSVGKSSRTTSYPNCDTSVDYDEEKAKIVDFNFAEDSQTDEGEGSEGITKPTTAPGKTVSASSLASRSSGEITCSTESASVSEDSYDDDDDDEDDTQKGPLCSSHSRGSVNFEAVADFLDQFTKSRRILHESNNSLSSPSSLLPSTSTTIKHSRKQDRLAMLRFRMKIERLSGERRRRSFLKNKEALCLQLRKDDRSRQYRTSTHTERCISHYQNLVERYDGRSRRTNFNQARDFLTKFMEQKHIGTWDALHPNSSQQSRSESSATRRCALQRSLSVYPSRQTTRVSMKRFSSVSDRQLSRNSSMTPFRCTEKQNLSSDRLHYLRHRLHLDKYGGKRRSASFRRCKAQVSPKIKNILTKRLEQAMRISM